MQLFLKEEENGTDGGDHIQKSAHDRTEHKKADGEERTAEQLAKDQMALLFLLIREDVAGHGNDADRLTDNFDGSHSCFLSG